MSELRALSKKKDRKGRDGCSTSRRSTHSTLQPPCMAPHSPLFALSDCVWGCSNKVSLQHPLTKHDLLSPSSYPCVHCVNQSLSCSFYSRRILLRKSFLAFDNEMKGLLGTSTEIVCTALFCVFCFVCGVYHDCFVAVALLSLATSVSLINVSIANVHLRLLIPGRNAFTQCLDRTNHEFEVNAPDSYKFFMDLLFPEVEDDDMKIMPTVDYQGFMDTAFLQDHDTLMAFCKRVTTSGREKAGWGHGGH